MTWRGSALVGTIASLGFVAGIANVWAHRQDGVPTVMFALRHPHHLRPYHPSARILFASLAVGGVCLAAAPLLRGRSAAGVRRWHWALLAGVVVSVIMVGGGLTIYGHPPDHRACHIAYNQTPHTARRICWNEPDKVFGRTTARYLITSAGMLVVVTLAALPLVARTERLRRPTQRGEPGVPLP